MLPIIWPSSPPTNHQPINPSINPSLWKKNVFAHTGIWTPVFCLLQQTLSLWATRADTSWSRSWYIQCGQHGQKSITSLQGPNMTQLISIHVVMLTGKSCLTKWENMTVTAGPQLEPRKCLCFCSCEIVNSYNDYLMLMKVQYFHLHHNSRMFFSHSLKMEISCLRNCSYEFWPIGYWYVVCP